MTKWFLLLLTVLVSAPAALAQDSDFKRYEFYGGYAYQRANKNSSSFDRNGTASIGGTQVIFGNRDQAYNGFTAEFNQNPWRHVGLVSSFTGWFDRTSYVNLVNVRSFFSKVQR